MYEKSIHEATASLGNCVGFIDCTKIQICPLDGEGSNQYACYSGHKCFHCLIY